MGIPGGSGSNLGKTQETRLFSPENQVIPGAHPNGPGVARCISHPARAVEDGAVSALVKCLAAPAAREGGLRSCSLAPPTQELKGYSEDREDMHMSNL